ncbi:MAG: MFS transporter [Anaerolineaceae bacterium]|nr:MFS transporter [Anaerolineaceae bacterium]
MSNEKKGMRTFVIIWLGQLVSLIGSGLIGFALSVWVFDQTGQATPFALTALFSVLPRILLSPIGGALSDRFNRKAIMLISDTLAGLVTLATAFLLLTGRMEIWMIYMISALEAVFGAFQQPAYTASVVMLVPKEQLTRANSMMQMGEAIQSIITPLLAGALVTTVGMKGIIIIDIATYLLALSTLIFVRIPQPERKLEAGNRFSVLKDVAFGWHYLVARKGLFGLLLYFASVNFFMNLSAVMLGPLVLSFGSATSLGVTQTVMGLGMLVGSLIMSVWGGFKKGKVKATIGFIMLSAAGFMVAGLRPSVLYVCIGLFLLVFFLPFGSGPSAALFASKVAPDIQGRVFATRSMISQSMMPLAFILSGILADHVFNPLLVEGGKLANTFVGRWLGVGPSRGIGLMMISSGLILLVVSFLVYLNPRIRNIETEIPDAIPESAPTDISGEGQPEMVPVE